MNAPLASGPLDRRRVYIFPSRAGATLGVMLVIILLGAINYDNALAYLLAFLLGGLVMVAMLHTYRNLAGLRLLGAQARPVFAGEDAAFDCLIENTTVRPRYNVDVSAWPRGLSREQRRYQRRFTRRFDIEAAGSAGVAVIVEAHRRGWLTLDRIMLETGYPLGILRAWAYLEPRARCLVYPAPRGELPLPGALASGVGGRATAQLGVDDFAGLRRYTPGDPVRAIAWKTMAKAQDIMVKRFHGHSAAELWLSWEAAAPAGRLEARLSQLCAWVLEAARSGAAYGLDLPGTRIEPGRGARHRERCLATLALYAPPA